MVWLYRAEPAMSTFPTVQPTNKINGNKYTQTAVSHENARPSSGHTGLVNVAFLGGNVISMNEGIDYHVYQALLTPHTKASDVPNPGYLLKEGDYAN